MSKEEWRDIKFTDTDGTSYDYTGLYQISNMGRVKSLVRECETILKLDKTKDGYCRIRLYKDGIYKKFGVHRLVAHMFIPNPENKPTVDHINTVRDDNRVCNLRWFTQKEQMNDNEISRDRFIEASKLITKKLNNFNEANNYSCCKENIKKASEASKKKCLCIATGEIFESVRKAAIEYEIDASGITKCCKGKQKYCGKLPDGTKLKWKYIEED